ncbi:hypothetical protein Q1695_001259 [Nippostrongylus brasiliensis]|nr:hypothetical protein Q1695_001259 [Nippostrongylus brasiliensis]
MSKPLRCGSYFRLIWTGTDTLESKWSVELASQTLLSIVDVIGEAVYPPLSKHGDSSRIVSSKWRSLHNLHNQCK